MEESQVINDGYKSDIILNANNHKLFAADKDL